ncbi:SMI1/KNR4 family protein [Blastopirellula marina]|uniref:SMI1/KNR4 family protein n=1 Tax=Blastopirellula marina TaxID=124 RepID=UPI0013048185|nr:SMI1/KNR4 family protein [Blastopirellula marina]
MTDADIRRIEKATGCPLPESYAQLLLNFPPELTALLKLDPPDTRLLFTDAKTIVHWNKFFRAPDYEYEDSYGEMRKFPPSHIVIGANQGGDFYHLNVKRKGTPVLIWEHDSGEIEKEAKDLPSYIRSIFSSAAMCALDRAGLG